jgi:hypothetical protein
MSVRYVIETNQVAVVLCPMWRLADTRWNMSQHFQTEELLYVPPPHLANQRRKSTLTAVPDEVWVVIALV